MPLRVVFRYTSGSSLGYSIERLSDGLLFDFADGTFKSTPGTLVAVLPESTGSFLGRFRATLSPTPSGTFTNGAYLVTVHDRANGNAVVDELDADMYAGDDAPVFPSGAGADPWSVALPGSYGSGTAGAMFAALYSSSLLFAAYFPMGTVVSGNAGQFVADFAPLAPANFSEMIGIAVGVVPADGVPVFGTITGAGSVSGHPTRVLLTLAVPLSSAPATGNPVIYYSPTV